MAETTTVGPHIDAEYVEAVSRREGAWRFTRRLFKSRSAQVGGIIVALLLLAAIFGPAVVPYDPFDVQTEIRLLPPSLEHPFGTDELGRDLFSRIVYGARYTLMIGLVVTGIACGFGFVIGLSAAYFGGWVDMLVMRLIDIMLSFPYILLSLVVVAMLGPSLLNAMVAVGIAGIASYARLIRGFVLSTREQEYVLASQALGAGDMRIMGRHVLPNILSPMVVFITYRLPLAVLAAAALSYLGSGTQPPIPEWGAMMVNARTEIIRAPWVVMAPGLAIFVVILGMNLFGNGLRDALDPYLKNR